MKKKRHGNTAFLTLLNKKNLFNLIILTAQFFNLYVTVYLLQQECCVTTNHITLKVCNNLYPSKGFWKFC